MANEEHVARLKQGVVAWNEWRAENDRAPVDLSYARRPERRRPARRRPEQSKPDAAQT